MSFSRPNFPARQTIRRRKTALFGQFRQDFLLKFIALLSAVVLYIYVQAEHNPNPQSSAQFQADIIFPHLEPNLEIDPNDKQVTVIVTGPRIIVENLKDRDVKAQIDPPYIPTGPGKTPPLHLKYVIPRLKQDALDQLTIVGPNTIRPRLYALMTKNLPVHITLRSAPVGFHYERPELDPEQVTVSGHTDNVSHVSKVVVDYKTSGDGRIQGEFPVDALDSSDNPVSDVFVSPSAVKVKVPLIEDPPQRLVVISPAVTTLPLPPYKIEAVTVSPSRVKVIGKPDQIEQLATVETEGIGLRDATQDQTMEVNLAPPPNVTVYDLQGHVITRVSVHFTIRKATVTPSNQQNPPVNTDPGTSSGTPADGGT